MVMYHEFGINYEAPPSKTGGLNGPQHAELTHKAETKNECVCVSFKEQAI